LAAELAYAGAQACSPCHADIEKRQEARSHARSLRPPAEIPEIASRIPFETRDKTSGATLLLRRSADGNLELAAQKPGAEDRMELKWAFGSGTKGITPVGLRENGEFAESRLTWYRSLESFDLTTGAADGTTTATILAQAIYREGVKAVTSGANPMAIKRGIEKVVEVAVEEVKKLSKPVTGDMVAQVGHDFRQQRRDHRQPHRRGDEEGR